MKRIIGVSALAAGLALTGCENSVEAPAEDTSAAAEETAAAGEGDATSETGATDTDTDTGATDTEASDTDATGTDATGTDATGTGATGSDATGTDAGAMDGSMITDEVMNRVQEQFPAMAAVVPRDQLRSLVSDVCGAVGSGNVASAQQEMQQRFGLDTSTSEQVVSFLEREVCTA